MPETYVPILRNGRNEPPVISEFNRSSLSNTSTRELSMTPLVEITDKDDLNDLSPFIAAGEFSMMELPQYLTDRANKFQNPVTKIIDGYGSVTEFYLAEQDKLEIPVISGALDPLDYTYYPSAYRTIADEFERIAVRILLTDFNNELTGDQKHALEELADELSARDIVLFDLVDNGVTDSLESDLEYLAQLFPKNCRAVLNAFDAYNEYPDNQSPHLADEFGISGFGDFGINQRFKPDGNGGPQTVKIRHYHPNHSTVKMFEGDDYDEASNELEAWNEWDRAHCDGCRRANRTSNYDVNTWSQIKMHHYFSSIIQNEI